LLDAAVVRVDAANDLALLKAGGRFAPLPIAASRPVKRGGTVAMAGSRTSGGRGLRPRCWRTAAVCVGGAGGPRGLQANGNYAGRAARS